MAVKGGPLRAPWLRDFVTLRALPCSSIPILAKLAGYLFPQEGNLNAIQRPNLRSPSSYRLRLETYLATDEANAFRNFLFRISSLFVLDRAETLE